MSKLGWNPPRRAEGSKPQVTSRLGCELRTSRNTGSCSIHPAKGSGLLVSRHAAVFEVLQYNARKVISQNLTLLEKDAKNIFLSEKGFDISICSKDTKPTTTRMHCPAKEFLIVGEQAEDADLRPSIITVPREECQLLQTGQTHEEDRPRRVHRGRRFAAGEDVSCPSSRPKEPQTEVCLSFCQVTPLTKITVFVPVLFLLNHRSTDLQGKLTERIEKHVSGFH